MLRVEKKYQKSDQFLYGLTILCILLCWFQISYKYKILISQFFLNQFTGLNYRLYNSTFTCKIKKVCSKIKQWQWILVKQSTISNTLIIHIIGTHKMWDMYQAWGQVHWYLYLSTLKYTLLSTCTCTSVLLFFNHSTCTCT